MLTEKGMEAAKRQAFIVDVAGSIIRKASIDPIVQIYDWDVSFSPGDDLIFVGSEKAYSFDGSSIGEEVIIKNDFERCADWSVYDQRGKEAGWSRYNGTAACERGPTRQDLVDKAKELLAAQGRPFSPSCALDLGFSRPETKCEADDSRVGASLVRETDRDNPGE